MKNSNLTAKTSMDLTYIMTFSILQGLRHSLVCRALESKGDLGHQSLEILVFKWPIGESNPGFISELKIKELIEKRIVAVHRV